MSSKYPLKETDWDDPIPVVIPATSGTSGIVSSQPVSQIFEFLLWLGRNIDIQSFHDKFLEETRQSQLQVNQGIGAIDDNEPFDFESFPETSSRNASSQIRERDLFSGYSAIQAYGVEAGNSQEEATGNIDQSGREVDVPQYNEYRATQTFSIDTSDNQEETTADTTQSGSESYRYNVGSWDLGAGARLPW
ncbi:uncharacterized protein H6S33_001366 [Morchella sextelata]|uniref:uncharacterized protein n=1 Tax=Morchella sextelata TaxID=1174677 RepID=UPI001D04A69D|nr:uncharacterized protein H6S33_001366 [Morchella sextelata]KAH0609138.1 hypothetical protein H6S33_001366 [Morchella sextelata]